MKKLLTALVACLSLAGSAFAIDLTADVNFGVPMTFTTQHINVDVNDKNYTHTTIKNQETGIGGDLGLMAMFTKEIGIKLDFGFYVPQSMTTTTTTTTSIIGNVTTSDPTTTKTTYSNENVSRSSINVFVGPTYKVTSNASMAVYVTPGFNLDSRTYTTKSGDTTTKTTYTYYGAGAEVQARFKINKQFALNVTCPVIYNFKVVDSSDKESDTKGLYVVPMIGATYFF